MKDPVDLHEYNRLVSEATSRFGENHALGIWNGDGAYLFLYGDAEKVALITGPWFDGKQYGISKTLLDARRVQLKHIGLKLILAEPDANGLYQIREA
jgi:hypothetical protein